MGAVRTRSKARQAVHAAANRHSGTGTSDRSSRVPRQQSVPPTRVRSRVNFPTNAGRSSSVPVIERQKPMRIRGRLRHYLLAELTALERARSVAGCLAVAMHDAASWSQGPYYPDVAHSVSELMTRTIVRLSDLLLEGRLPGTTRSDELP
jgi:hypothetical protein